MLLRLFISVGLIFILSCSAFGHVFAYSPFLAQGDSGRDVLDCQKRLRMMGYKVGKLDGVFAADLTQAVQAFQRKSKLKSTGVISSKEYRIIIGKEMAVDKRLSLLRRHIADSAGEQLGVPYKFGGAVPSGFDCSGYTTYIFKKHGISLPRSADKQYLYGKKIKKSELEIGDLVFFTTYETGPSHVGIYVGDDKFIHVSSSKGVMISHFNDYYWKNRFVGACRIIKERPVQKNKS